MPALVTPGELAGVLEGDQDKSFCGDTEHLVTAIGRNELGGIVQTNYQALALIKPDEGAASLTKDLAVYAGQTITGMVLGPEGRPLAGATLNGAPLATAFFTLAHVNPRRTQRLEFHHPARQLGLYRVIRGDETQPVRVRLQPYGSAAGRLADKEGKPIRDLPMRVNDSVGETDIRTKTDGKGRFRVENLIAGHTYTLVSPVGLPLLGENGDVSFPPFTIEPGKVKDLGEARAR
jgi:hypothetical protein